MDALEYESVDQEVPRFSPKVIETYLDACMHLSNASLHYNLLFSFVNENIDVT